MASAPETFGHETRNKKRQRGEGKCPKLHLRRVQTTNRELITRTNRLYRKTKNSYQLGKAYCTHPKDYVLGYFPMISREGYLAP